MNVEQLRSKLSADFFVVAPCSPNMFSHVRLQSFFLSGEQTGRAQIRKTQTEHTLHGSVGAASRGLTFA